MPPLAPETGTNSAALQVLQESLRDANLVHGREDSFKLSHGVLLDQRVMIGVRTRDLSSAALGRITDRLGMPKALLADLKAELHRANVLLFGAEQAADGCSYKVYLEFWDEVRAEVLRTGVGTPQLLNLGYKWRAGAAVGRTARYTCFPLLSIDESLNRLRAVYAPASDGAAWQLADELIRRCAMRSPNASFVYMEVLEEGTPRCSFDINLYKAAMPMQAISPWLARLREHFGVPRAEFDQLQARIHPLILGHMSGGLDRDGREFITVYYEIQAL